jgi:hypothetical protein
MPTLRFGKVWQVIRHFGVLFFCNLGTPKTVISNFVPTRQIETPYSSPCKYMVTPTMFPWYKKASRRQKSQLHFCINSLVRHKLSHDRKFCFWGGCLRVPTRRCDLVVPADWKKHVWNLFWGNGTENMARRVLSRQL